MEDQNVAIRLKGFIESEGLSHSQFADRCGIPRPSLSQILSGRNKKISDVIIGQIHKAYPELSVLWLLFGEGAMRVGGQSSGGSDKDASAGSMYSVEPGGAVGESFSDENYDESTVFDSSDGVPMATVTGYGADQRHAAAFDEKNGVEGLENAGNRSGVSEFSNVNALNTHVQTIQRLEKQLKERDLKIDSLQTQIEKITKNPRKVSHITVYYDDSTFETFTPQS